MPRAGVARALKANPDDARVHARRLALERGKVVVMTVPRLGDERPGEVR